MPLSVANADAMRLEGWRIDSLVGATLHLLTGLRDVKGAKKRNQCRICPPACCQRGFTTEKAVKFVPK